jgi:histidinol-phosphate aminotransferase
MQDTLLNGLNPNVKMLEPYQPGKPIEELTRELGVTDVIKLASNENPRGPGIAVHEALARAATTLSRYPDGSGYRLKRALSAHLDVAPECITLGNGSNDVLELIARVALTPGAEAVVSEHAFVVYPLAVIANGGRLVTVPALDYGANLTAMTAAITDATRLVFLANPNNPTGTWVDRASLERFLEQVPRHVLVVLDEAYFEYLDDPSYPDGVALVGRFPNVVVTRTFSKIYGLAGLRVGYAVSNPAIADLLNRVRQPFNVSSIALECAQAALADQEFVASSREINARGLSQLYEAFAARGLRYVPSGGNFVTVGFGRDAAPIYEALLHCGVIVRPIANYGMPEHLRVTVGLEHENQRFLSSLMEVLSA